MSEQSAVRAGCVLVTGAGGFLGTNVVWTLREQGFAVRALVRRPPSGPQWNGLTGVEFAIGDIRNSRQVAQALDGVRAVIHSAALTRLIPRPRRDAYRINVDATRALCEAALQAGVRRLVFTSSASTIAHGSAAQPATEDSPDNREPIHAPYSASKRLAERVVRAFHARGLETIVLCPGYVLGPRDDRPTTNELLLYAARWRWPLFPPGGMNVIDVREASLAHVRALNSGQLGERYLLAGPYCAYAELGNLVKRILRLPGRVLPFPSWTRIPGSMLLSLASGIWPNVPNGLTVPSFQYGFVPYHLNGQRADDTFHLTHRPVEDTVSDTLQWFRDIGRLRPSPFPHQPTSEE
jgi:dihydroflavonol-4-reductase